MEPPELFEQAMTGTTPRILPARIAAGVGVKGDGRITSHTQDPQAIVIYGPLMTNRRGLDVTVASARVNKTGLSARLRDVHDRLAADRLNVGALSIKRSPLPEI